MMFAAATPVDQRLRVELRGALERAEFGLAYLPRMCLTSGEVIGAQAMPYWHSPRAGMVPPSVFVPLLEEQSLVGEFTSWALHVACTQAARWRDGCAPALRVSMALAALNLRGDLVRTLDAALADTGLPPQGLCIEIPEGALPRDAGRLCEQLRRVQGRGIQIALDEFGAGFSSLAHLRELPLDIVKIHRSAVHDFANTDVSVSLTRAVVQLAHGLQLRVVAEGVANEDQLRTVLGIGCDSIQGDVFAGALEPEAFTALLASGVGLPRDLTHRRERQRTLLLVDDEEGILSALKRLFRRDGYRVLTACSGARGLEVLAEHPVDVIVSDQRMPGMAGVDFLRRAKELYPRTVRMTLSGYTDLQSIIDAVNEGAVYKFLTKPWDDDRLREHVALAFSQSEMAEENRRLSHEVTTANAGLAAANRRLERLVAQEHDRVNAMQVAARAARDMVDLIPLAVLGVDAQGMLAYANQDALADWPHWAADLGGEPAAELRELFERLEAEPMEAPAQGIRAHLAGRETTVWLRHLAGGDGSLSRLLIIRSGTPS